MTTQIMYEAATGTIVAAGQFTAPQDGCFLGVVYDDAPLQQPGTKRLVLGRVEVTPPPPPDPAVVAQQQADAQQDATDRTTVRDALAQLATDAGQLTDATVVLTAGQQRAMLARTNRTVVALARLLRRNGAV